MKYSKATDYALHTMFFLAKNQDKTPINVNELAKEQDISPTYLSKILTKLSKEQLIKANSGANGGYSIQSNWQTITFFDVIQAVEGKQSLFECYVHDDPNCDIKKVMFHAEKIMEDYLRSQTLTIVLEESN